MKFGKITLLNYVQHNGRYKWKGQCDCGNITYNRTCRYTSDNPISSCNDCARKILSILPNNLSKKNRMIRQYKRRIQKKGLEFDLTNEQFLKLIEQDCNYCGRSSTETPNIQDLKINGIDRINSSKGYNLENVVTCCSDCNKMKLDYSEEYFYNLIKLIHHNIFEKSSTTIPQGSTLQANGGGKGNHPNKGEDIV